MTNQLPTRTPEREKIFDIIDGERDYQNKTHSASGDLVHFANLLIEYTDKLAVDVQVDPSGASPAGGPFKRLREIAAIAVHAMESHGVQPRENHVPASAGITGTAHIVGKPDSAKPAAPSTAVHTPAAPSTAVHTPAAPAHSIATEHSAAVDAAHHHAEPVQHAEPEHKK